MAKNFFQPMKMESQFVDTKLFNVISEAEVLDGQLITLGDFAQENVYTAAYKSAFIDFNTRKTGSVTATALGVCVIDLPTVATANGMGNTYRIGAKTIGLTAQAKIPVRARKLVADDTFVTGADNCTAALTVGQFATVDATGKWKPAATAPADGCYCKVVAKQPISEGVTASTDGYTLVVVAN